jgi:hypothetical protein
MKVLIGSFTAESNSWNPFHEQARIQREIT